MKDYGEIPCNLGGGPLTIRCKYGNILKNPSNAIYYKCNMESSGVELRYVKELTAKREKDPILGSRTLQYQLHFLKDQYLSSLDLLIPQYLY